VRREMRSNGLDPERLWLMVYPGFLSSILAVLLPSAALLLGRRTVDVLASGLIGVALATATTAALVMLPDGFRTPVFVRVSTDDAARMD
jgi:hypothetical protein